MSRYVIGTVTILALVCSGLSIKCFQCSSYEHPECADLQVNDTSSPHLHECEPRDNHKMFCRKIIQTVLDAPKFTRITRSCGWLVYKSNESLCQVTDTDFKLETNCQCFTEACNGASPLVEAVERVVTLTAMLSLLLRGLA